MNALAAVNHVRWFQFRIQQVLLLTLAVALAVPLVNRARERWKTLPERPAMPSSFSTSTKPDRTGTKRTSIEEMRQRGWILLALRSDMRSTTPTLVLATDGSSAVASNDQDREQRKRILLEKTINVWDYPITPIELLDGGTLTIETTDDVRVREATAPPASGIPTFRIDRTNILSAPETTVREREPLEWLRIHIEIAVRGLLTPNGEAFESPDDMDWSADSLGEMLVAKDMADRERRKRIQLE